MVALAPQYFVNYRIIQVFQGSPQLDSSLLPDEYMEERDGEGESYFSPSFSFFFFNFFPYVFFLRFLYLYQGNTVLTDTDYTDG